METKNFVGYIAIPLEQYSRRVQGDLCCTSAGKIETGQFVETMIAILQRIYPSREDYAAFCEQCEVYDGKRASEIPLDRALELFAEFERLFQASNWGKE